MTKSIISLFAVLMMATVSFAHCGTCGVGDAKSECGAECADDCSKCLANAAATDEHACEAGCECDKCVAKAAAAEDHGCETNCECEKCVAKEAADHAHDDHSGHNH